MSCCGLAREEIQKGAQMRSLECRFAVSRLSWIATLALALIAGPALAQKADRPTVKVGDRWLFAMFYGADPSAIRVSDRLWVITSVTSAAIEGTENGEKLVLTPELNNIESPERKDSDLWLLNFPLEVGKKWSFDDDFVNYATQGQGRFNVTAEVVGYEELVVLAGKFEAFKLEAKGSWLVHGNSGETAWTYWYAPAARAVVKSEYRHTYTTTSKTTVRTTELAKFELQP